MTGPPKTYQNKTPFTSGSLGLGWKVWKLWNLQGPILHHPSAKHLWERLHGTENDPAGKGKTSKR